MSRTVSKETVSALAATGAVACLAFPVAPDFIGVVQTVWLLIIPGVCLVSVLNVPSGVLSQLVVVTVSLSISTCLVLFGVLNLAAAALGDWHALDRPSLVLVNAGMFSVLAFVVRLLGHDLELTVPGRPRTSDLVALAVAASALVQAVAGALILNEGGPGAFALVSYTFVGAAFLALMLPRNAPSSGIAAMVLVMSALALLLSNSLRSSYVSASDINYEFQIASMVQAHGVWDPSTYRDAYMACLSSSLYPVVLSTLSGLSLLTVFKVVMPAIFALVAVLVLQLGRVFLSDRGAVVAAFFFVVQPGFQQWLSIPVRQQVALLLFATSLWALLASRWSRTSRMGVFWLSALGMVLSHYSTAYIACLFLLFAVALRQVFRSRRTLRLGDERVFSWASVVALAAVAVVWYGPVTTQSYALVEFTEHSLKGMGNALDPTVQQEGQSAFNGFGLFGGATQVDLVQTYVQQATKDYQAEYGAAALLASSSPPAPAREAVLAPVPAHEPWYTALRQLRSGAKLVAVLLIALGIAALWRRRRTRDMGDVLVFSAFASVLILVVLPFISVSYDLMRLYQQFLILLAPMLVVGFTALHRRRSRGRRVLGAGLVLAYFALLSRVPFQVVGGPEVSMTFNNRGWDYAIYYASQTEAATGRWLTQRWRSDGSHELVFADPAAAARLRLVAPLDLSKEVKLDLLPTTVVRGSYLFLDRKNLETGGSVTVYRNDILSLNLDRRYFDTWLNRVYSTTDTAVYH